MRLYIETALLAAGLIAYFVGGLYMIREYQLVCKMLFGGH